MAEADPSRRHLGAFEASRPGTAAEAERADIPASRFAPDATGEIPATRLTAPAAGWEWFDADPFLMLAKMQLQSLAPDPSDGDLEF